MQTIEVTFTHLAELEAKLQSDGFRPGVPGHVRRATQEIDRGLCAGMACLGCGREGMSYRPWAKGTRYRAVAACGTCQYAEEI